MAQGRSHTYIDGATQIDNLGDDIIVRQLLRMLATRSNLAVDVRAVPDWAAELMEIDPATAHGAGNFTLGMLRRGLRSRLGFDKDRTFLVLKPGHIGGRYDARQTLGRLGLVGLTALCRILRIGVIRLGFSVDDLKQPLLSVECVQARLQTVYAPRDDVSLAYADSVGIRCSGRSTDLAFTLGVHRNPHVQRHGVVLSFADSTDGNQRDSYADRLAGFLGDLVDELTRSGTDVRYCAQVIRDGQFGDRVLGQDNSVQRVAFQRSASSAAAVFDTYASAEVVLTNRLHSFLFALSQGALAVVVTDPAIHGKIVGIIRDMGLPELLVDLNGLDSETLIGHIDRVLADGEGILDRVSAHFDEQAERLHHWVDGWLGTPVDPDRRVVTDARAA